jgi:hypothetical protein
MKKLIVFLFVMFCSGFIACEKNNVEPLKPEGIWVESTKGTDTMVFDNLNARFVLNRGKEMQGEFLMPLSNSGPYDYKLINDSISVKYDGASIPYYRNFFANYSNFYFKMDSQKQQFQIGNFYVDSLGQHDILTFTKIQ